MLDSKISKNEIEVDMAKIETIERLPPLSSGKAVRSFLGHTGFIGDSLNMFQRFQDFLQLCLRKMHPLVFMQISRMPLMF